ncbi:RagB/SusD family nutrient uptake outer membrane protein [Dinghuibacter silviterrae]|uniref:Putative outer membrane starch-binding protein n=1 Tax=Dinghuibacter silviterrae TaxID=1539049 RepID=A0A4V3GKI9_9BACT|nr:RagB/SusD family nutrient uptake outer membrane protein [Dinghuibacter silviterrae]TDW95822.1 putative outer membrane starch-binding protein [Dinghuibacter silviterrae]
MKKNIIIVSLILLAALGGCKKGYLNESPYSTYSPSTLTDSLGFEAAVFGLYEQTSLYYTYSSNQGWPSVWQVGTDVAFATQPQGIEVPYYNYANLISTDPAADFEWTWAYQLINDANAIIANVEKPGLNSIGAADKADIDGEAHFFRGYAYEQLAICFGGVPVVTAPLTAPKTDFVRASLDTVNGLIVSDLQFAATNLPDIEAVKSNSAGKMYGRANKYMAMQTLAECYLRMNQGALAEQQTQAIINSGKFSLVNNRYGIHASQPGDPFSDMFVYGNQRRKQGNTEAIWVLEQTNPSTAAGGTSGSGQQRRNWGAAYYKEAGMVICDSLGGRGIGRMRLSNWVLYQLYAAGDMRNSEYNIRRHYWYNDATKPATYGQPVPYDNSDTVYILCPHTTKWYCFDPNDVFGYATIKDYIIMRLGETYLLQAEAQLQEGHQTDAAASINALRTRAGAPQVTASQITLDFILDERARELIGEENRRMTLMRTGKLVTRTLALNPTSVVNPVTGLTNTDLLLPIPQNEIYLNKDAVLTQNPGY